jgi:DNA-binding beta-propeller fold protein YncE
MDLRSDTGSKRFVLITSAAMRFRFWVRKRAFVALLLLKAYQSGQGSELLNLSNEIPLPGVQGRIDHFAADVPGQRLFIAALENGSVEILDLQRWTLGSEIKGLKEPQGVYYNDQTNRLYVTTGGDGTLRIYDGKFLAFQTMLELGGDADNIRVGPQSSDIWVGYGNGGIAVIDSKDQKIGTISLGSHPESFQFDQPGDRVYVNVPTQFGVTVIDRKRGAVVTKWGLDFSFANYPMAFDVRDKRLFIGCRFPAQLVVLDATSGKIVGKWSTIGDSDDIFYDTDRHRVYIIGGEGAVEVFRQNGPDYYESLGRVKTAPGARTGFLLSGYLFVAVPNLGAQTARVLVYNIR